MRQGDLFSGKKKQFEALVVLSRKKKFDHMIQTLVPSATDPSQHCL